MTFNVLKICAKILSTSSILGRLLWKMCFIIHAIGSLPLNISLLSSTAEFSLSWSPSISLHRVCSDS